MSKAKQRQTTTDRGMVTFVGAHRRDNREWLSALSSSIQNAVRFTCERDGDGQTWTGEIIHVPRSTDTETQQTSICVTNGLPVGAGGEDLIVEGAFDKVAKIVDSIRSGSLVHDGHTGIPAYVPFDALSTYVDTVRASPPAPPVPVIVTSLETLRAEFEAFRATYGR